MSKVVSLAKVREDKTPHCAGKAVCTACKHEWEAVAPVGVIWLGCPSCGTERGTFKRHHEPEDGTSVWNCNHCDTHLFTIISDGRCICAGCGETHWPWANP